MVAASRVTLSLLPISQRGVASSSAARVAADPINEHVALLVQEWLTIAKLPRTLQCFLDESTQSGRAPPAMSKWFEMTQKLDVHAFGPDLASTDVFAPSTKMAYQQKSQPQPHIPVKRSLLELIVERTFAERRRAVAKEQALAQAQQPATVLISKRPLTTKDQLKFASKRSLPGTTQSHSKSVSLLPPPLLGTRPQSAAVSKSTSDLVHGRAIGPPSRNGVREEDTVTGASDNNNNHSNRRADTPDKQAQRKTRPISASGVLTPHRDSTANSLQRRRKASSAVLGSDGGSPSSPNPGSPAGSVRSRSSRLMSSVSVRNMISEMTAGAPATTTHGSEEVSSDGDIHNAEHTEETVAAVLDLEELNEERLTQQFSSFSKGTIKKLRRVLAKSSAHSQELQRTRRAMDKIQQKAIQQEQRAVIAAEQTELLSTTMDMIIKEPCSLCRHIFLKKNLATKVSYKSICDLRASWAAVNPVSNAAVDTARAPGKATSPDGDEDDDTNVIPPGQALDSSQISHLYDEAPVCVFCAQLVLNFSSYRPSSAEQRQRKEEKRRDAQETQRRRETQRQRDRQRCDPLAFDSLLLNSDDDDSDVEEVVEYDPEGRPQVVRRRRQRRVASRVPAQLGLVSKRVHYDHLRSKSVHALNRKEWDVIVNGRQTDG